MKDVPRFIQGHQIAPFYRADPEYGTGIATGLGILLKEIV